MAHLLLEICAIDVHYVCGARLQCGFVVPRGAWRLRHETNRTVTENERFWHILSHLESRLWILWLHIKSTCLEQAGNDLHGGHVIDDSRWIRQVGSQCCWWHTMICGDLISRGMSQSPWPKTGIVLAHLESWCGVCLVSSVLSVPSRIGPAVHGQMAGDWRWNTDNFPIIHDADDSRCYGIWNSACAAFQ